MKRQNFANLRDSSFFPSLRSSSREAYSPFSLQSSFSGHRAKVVKLKMRSRDRMVVWSNEKEKSFYRRESNKWLCCLTSSQGRTFYERTWRLQQLTPLDDNIQLFSLLISLETTCSKKLENNSYWLSTFAACFRLSVNRLEVIRKKWFALNKTADNNNLTKPFIE